MNFIYRSQGLIIYPHRQMVEVNGLKVQVRPKTFALLLALIERPREILSKDYLINRIWDDVKVEEQVLVQSIRELRQISSDAKIIQTYPRKGYAWAADVSKVVLENSDEPLELNSAAITLAIKEKKSKSRRVWIYSLCASAVIIAAIFLGFHFKQASSFSIQTSVIVVMPMKNHIQGKDHDWVPLGGMDSLIRQLISNKNTQVMPVDYVLQLMSYAKLPFDYDPQQAPKIFDVSGATLIVESEVSGNVEDYELTYKLRYKNDVKRGVIYEKEITKAIEKLAQRIVEQTGQQLKTADSRAESALTNELMARAQEKMQLLDYDAAEGILTSIIQMDSKNALAREKLVEVLVRAEKFDKAKSEVESALAMVSTDNPRNQITLLFWRGILFWRVGEFQSALNSLAEAQQVAEAANDFLFLSRIAEISGHIQEEQGTFNQAQLSYEQALKFDQLIRCPVGISSNHINLAKLYLRQHKNNLANEQYLAAKSIIDAHQFSDMNPLLESAKRDNGKLGSE